MKPSYKICSTQLQLLFSSLGSTPAREVSKAAVIGTRLSLVQSYWAHRLIHKACAGARVSMHTHTFILAPYTCMQGCTHPQGSRLQEVISSYTDPPTHNISHNECINTQSRKG